MNGMKKPITTTASAEREFVRIFQRLSQKYSSWNVWRDFVYMGSASITNAVDKRPGIWHKRENEYLAITKHYRRDEVDAFAQLLSLTTLALELNPAQDFLGRLYMQFGISNHWQGQFFTPWAISDLMARIVIENDLESQLKEQGYISVSDSSCGAGCMMIAFANVCLSQGVNYQQSVLFVGQDIDPVVAKMCYIQISLLGCPGYVLIGNTITEPSGGTTLNPFYQRPENIWFTPLYFTGAWAARRAIEKADLLFSSGPAYISGNDQKPRIDRSFLPIRTLLKGGNDE